MIFATSAGSAASAMAGAGLLAAGATLPGAILVALALALGISLWLGSQSWSAPSQEDIAIAELGRRSDAAAARADGLGLPHDAGALRKLAADMADAHESERDRQSWESRRDAIRSEIAETEQELRTALADRGAEVFDPIADAAARYEEDCAERARAAAESAGRQSLEEQLGARSSAEAAHQEATEAVAASRARLSAAGEDAGVSGDSEQEIVDGLQRWRTERSRELLTLETARSEWTELQVLLDGSSLAELEAASTEAAARVAALSREADQGGIAGPEAADGDQIDSLRALATETGEALAAARARREQRAKEMSSVAVVKEEVASAERNLDRIEQLGSSLLTTRKFLQAAEEKAHRNIAPVLSSAVQSRIAEVTVGRYTGVNVDPSSLSVNLREESGAWREASFLSRGTAELVFLLLRVALAEHLTDQSEICPLLLDDVTVQADAARKQRMLELLHSISSDRQVILFAQEAEVLAWARARLAAPADSLVELT